MSKTLERTDTRERLLECAQDLMLRKGFVATSVDEICEAAGVTKGSFFYYFKNKDELGKQLVARFSGQMGEQIFGHVSKAGSDPLDRALAFVDAAIELSKCCETKGCLVGTFVQEISESHPALRECCNDSLEAARKGMEIELVAARKKYKPGEKIDARGLSESFMAITQGSLLMIKATQDRSLMTRTMTHFRQYLEGVFRKPKG
jgi:TetR/AcrR family transcriptional regulator, transcriptional repressor for nem operon